MPGDFKPVNYFYLKTESIFILSFVGVQAASISVLRAVENLPPHPLPLSFPCDIGHRAT